MSWLKVIKAGFAAVFGDIPLGYWLGAIAIGLMLLWHVSAVDAARQTARLKLKADIEAEAAKTGRQADAATRDVLACTGRWNRSTGRCEP
jgi:hypothetical protein